MNNERVRRAFVTARRTEDTNPVLMSDVLSNSGSVFGMTATANSADVDIQNLGGKVFAAGKIENNYDKVGRIELNNEQISNIKELAQAEIIKDRLTGILSGGSTSADVKDAEMAKDSRVILVSTHYRDVFEQARQLGVLKEGSFKDAQGRTWEVKFVGEDSRGQIDPAQEKEARAAIEKAQMDPNYRVAVVHLGLSGGSNLLAYSEVMKAVQKAATMGIEKGNTQEGSFDKVFAPLTRESIEQLAPDISNVLNRLTDLGYIREESGILKVGDSFDVSKGIDKNVFNPTGDEKIGKQIQKVDTLLGVAKFVHANGEEFKAAYEESRDAGKITDALNNFIRPKANLYFQGITDYAELQQFFGRADIQNSGIARMRAGLTMHEVVLNAETRLKPGQLENALQVATENNPGETRNEMVRLANEIQLENQSQRLLTSVKGRPLAELKETFNLINSAYENSARGQAIDAAKRAKDDGRDLVKNPYIWLNTNESGAKTGWRVYLDNSGKIIDAKNDLIRLAAPSSNVSFDFSKLIAGVYSHKLLRQALIKSGLTQAQASNSLNVLKQYRVAGNTASSNVSMMQPMNGFTSAQTAPAFNTATAKPFIKKFMGNVQWEPRWESFTRNLDVLLKDEAKNKEIRVNGIRILPGQTVNVKPGTGNIVYDENSLPVGYVSDVDRTFHRAQIDPKGYVFDPE
ncbi:MAG: hypothetical protein KGJ11_09790, partial [Candidatus Omnitrophica bacterium]|nr:hypothetical protein [Candidatus Omnitrophota bacterium]